MVTISEELRNTTEENSCDAGSTKQMKCQRKANHKGYCYMFLNGYLFSWRKS